MNVPPPPPVHTQSNSHSHSPSHSHAKVNLFSGTAAFAILIISKRVIKLALQMKLKTSIDIFPSADLKACLN